MVPRFTTIYHPIRVELGLNNNEYIFVDSVHQLSHSPEHPWCSQSKEQIAAFTGMSERTVYRARVVGLDKGLIETNERGDLRTTMKWVQTVVLYKQKTQKKR